MISPYAAAPLVIVGYWEGCEQSDRAQYRYALNIQQMRKTAEKQGGMSDRDKAC